MLVAALLLARLLSSSGLAADASPANPAQATPARISVDVKQLPAGLQLRLGRVSVFDHQYKSGSTLPSTRLEGRIAHPKGASLSIDTLGVQVKKDGTFDVVLPLVKREALYLLEFKPDASTPAQRLRLHLFYGGAPQDLQGFNKSDRRSSRFEVLAGVSALRFEQTGYGALSEKAISTRVAFHHAFHGRSPWELGLSLGGTPLAFGSSDPDSKLRILDFRASIAYQPHWPANLWRLQIVPGFYYLTTFSTNPDLGFQNVRGPMLYPVVTRLLPGGASLSVSARLSPVFSDSLGILKLSTNREIAFDATYLSRPSPGGAQWGPTLGYSDVRVDINDLDLKLRSFTLGLLFRI